MVLVITIDSLSQTLGRSEPILHDLPVLEKENVFFIHKKFIIIC